ncbi:glycosyltransferase family A protein [Streptomyces sp. NPDC006458]|uniref:glycosyltransferase family 2 protein n=1 Tax=Streptomyces sp. NPDC006458 TaxID=3154302 RepID=UPI0033BFB43D
MSEPTVTVVIGAYNALPYLTRCLESVAEQSLGEHTLECVVVDDGSTDGTGKEVERFAAEHPDFVRVVHQNNSGGPSGPRNVGIDLARGRYVFFLDADDHLGPHAMRRMIDMAERNSSDVVLGKYVGVGCDVPRSMFVANQEVVDLATSRVWYSLTPHKLFRRSFLLECGLRFDEDIRIGEDRIFVTKAYLQASAVSVVADEDCYFKVRRDDNGNITCNYRDLPKRFETARRIMAAIGAHSAPGPVRDAALLRTFRGGLLDSFSWRFPPLTVDEQLSAMAIVKQEVERFYTPEIDGQMTAPHRIFAHCARHGMRTELIDVIEFLEQEKAKDGRHHAVVVDGGRAYAAYPYFRDVTKGIPDSCYDITHQLGQNDRLDTLRWRRTQRRDVLRLTGHGYIERIPTREPATELVLRLRDDGREVRVPTRSAPLASPAADASATVTQGSAGFIAEIDFARAENGGPLTKGVWDVYLNVRTQGLSTQRRFGARKAESLTSPLPVTTGNLTVKPYYTALGNLSLDVTAAKKGRKPKRGIPRKLGAIGRRLVRLREVVRPRRRTPELRLPASAAASRA